jgi:hypothetical protein
MTGWADASFLAEVNSRNVATGAFQDFFVPNGLPKMVIYDSGSEFAGILQGMCKLLRIPAEGVAPENHRAIRNERFHRYLNKVESINTADTGALTLWKQGVKFAIYAWNASPIDGTNIIRSFVAQRTRISLPNQH